MPVGGGDWEHDGDESNEGVAISSACQRPRPTTQLVSFDLGTSDVAGHTCNNGDHLDTDTDEEEEVSRANDGTTLNVED